MKINNFDNSIRIKKYLIRLISCLVVFLSPTLSVFSQSTSDPFEIEFVKNADSLKTSDLYFNVLKIVNNSPKTIVGAVTFTCPENWNIFAFPNTLTQINPNDTAWIPLRVSPAADALGGTTYVINATFKTKNKQLSTNTYLTLPSKAKWEFSTNKTSIYFTETNPFATFKIKLSNKGNTNELIKLNLKLGKLLVFANNKNNESIEFVELPAYKDTIISHSVTYQKELSYEEKIRYENNWKESAIRVTASTEKTEKSAAIMIRKLNSNYENQRLQNASPLNIDYQVYNLMSSQAPRSNARLFGSILFPNNREFEYMGGLQNIYYTKAANQNFDIDRQLIYTLRYRDNRNRIEIGYNENGGNLHSINGRGIVGNFKVSNKTNLSYALTQNPFSKSIGEHVGISTTIKSASFNTELTHESNTDINYSATSVAVGTGFPLFKNQGISVQLLGSQSNYNLSTGRDTSVLGYSFKADYTMRYKKFNFRLSTLNSLHNYIRNSGFQNIYLDSKYTLNDKVRLSIYGNRQLYSTTRYPYNFYSDPNFNTTDYLRLTTSISGGNIIYQIGPNYNGSIREFLNPVSGFKSEYKTYQPGLWAAATYKLNGYRSLTPNLTISNLRFYYNTEDPTLDNYSLVNNIYYQVGINYYDTNWRLNAYYSSGTTSDLYRSVQINTEPTLSSSIQLRPSYESYFFNRTVRLSAYMNYAYYMPSGRENVSYNIKYDQFIKGGWMISLNGFVYSNTSVSDDLERITTKDLNFVVGISKSFNIQQPRLKYYDFKTVFYNDLDGNRIKTENEPPVTNVLVKIEKNREISNEQSSIPEVELISDANGQISFENLPKDNYNLVFNPLVNLESLYFLDGSVQKYYNDKKRTLYVPLAESYKIKGKIIVVRDPNSTEGKLDLSGIRITATSVKGENYSVLSDNFGTYIINIPNAERFKVSVNNVFGEQFQIENDEMDIQFIQNKTINLDFTFYEKKRGIEFENGTELYNFSSLTDAENTEEGKEETNAAVIEEKPVVSSVKSTNTSTQKGVAKNYSIELGTENVYVNPTEYKNKYNLKQDVLYSEKDGKYKYYIGTFTNPDDAQKEITRLGISGLSMVEVNPSELKKAEPDSNIKTSTSESKPGNTGIEQATKEPVEKATNAAKTTSTGITNTTDKVNKTDTDQINQIANNALTKGQTKTIKSDTVIVRNEKRDTIQKVKTTRVESQNINQTIQAKQPNKTNKAKPTIKTPELVTDSLTDGNYYSIQLDAIREYRDPKYYNEKYGLKLPVVCVEEDEHFKYLIGKYTSIENAKADISRYGMSGYIVLVEHLFK
ncbi:MAG: hypothetical protein PHS59_06320 [Paludibacter sp.]|nr:hypothetical protein [Paludibacter sp.]